MLRRYQNTPIQAATPCAGESVVGAIAKSKLGSLPGIAFRCNGDPISSAVPHNLLRTGELLVAGTTQDGLDKAPDILRNG